MKIIREIWRKMGAFLMLGVLGVSGCIAPKAAGNNSEDQVETLQISCLLEQFSDELPDISNAWMEEFQKRYGVKLVLKGIPTLTFSERFSYQILSSDEPPTIVMINNSIENTALFRKMILADKFWCLDDYIENFPNLIRYIGEESFQNIKIEGKLYGIPRKRILPRYTGYYRKDWADRLGIAAPQNQEELYEMLERFVTEDPDGNGQDDTIGVVGCLSALSNTACNGMQLLTVMNGGPNGWRFEDSKMFPDFESDAWKEMLDYFRKLYQNGILNQDFAVINAEQRREAITNDKTGMIFGVIDDVAQLESELKKKNPQAQLELLPVLESQKDGQKRLNSTSGNNGMILFTKQGRNAVKTEEELKKILGILDLMCTKEEQNFLLNGIENVNYTVNQQGEKIAILGGQNGTTVLEEMQKDFVQVLPVMGYQRLNENPQWTSRIDQEILDRNLYLVRDDSIGLFSETYVEKRTELDQIIQKACIRYIIGEIDREEYEQAYEQWYKEGGKDVIQEYTDEYKKKTYKQ